MPVASLLAFCLVIYPLWSLFQAFSFWPWWQQCRANGGWGTLQNHFDSTAIPSWPARGSQPSAQCQCQRTYDFWAPEGPQGPVSTGWGLRELVVVPRNVTGSGFVILGRDWEQDGQIGARGWETPSVREVKTRPGLQFSLFLYISGGSYFCPWAVHWAPPLGGLPGSALSFPSHIITFP